MPFHGALVTNQCSPEHGLVSQQYDFIFSFMPTFFFFIYCYAITERMPDLGEILREVNTGLSDIHRASPRQHLGRTEPGYETHKSQGM